MKLVESCMKLKKKNYFTAFRIVCFLISKELAGCKKNNLRVKRKLNAKVEDLQSLANHA